MHAPIEPNKTMHKTDMTWQEQAQEVQMGWASVQSPKLLSTLRKSSKKCTFLSDMVGKREGKYAEIKLPRTTSHAEALAISDKLALTSLGLVTTPGGFALRVLIEDELKAKALIDPEFARVVGGELMKTKSSPQNLYIVKGID